MLQEYTDTNQTVLTTK